jgi:hypothetical protein
MIPGARASTLISRASWLRRKWTFKGCPGSAPGTIREAHASPTASFTSSISSYVKP